MAYFNTCPVCGAHLDPNERCDCEQENHPSERTPTDKPPHIDCKERNNRTWTR